MTGMDALISDWCLEHLGSSAVGRFLGMEPLSALHGPERPIGGRLRGHLRGAGSLPRPLAVRPAAHTARSQHSLRPVRRRRATGHRNTSRIRSQRLRGASTGSIVNT